MDKQRTIEESLARIESLLQRLPEIQAAVLIQMQEEYNAAKFAGRKAADLWEVTPPNRR